MVATIITPVGASIGTKRAIAAFTIAEPCPRPWLGGPVSVSGIAVDGPSPTIIGRCRRVMVTGHGVDIDGRLGLAPSMGASDERARGQTQYSGGHDFAATVVVAAPALCRLRLGQWSKRCSGNDRRQDGRLQGRVRLVPLGRKARRDGSLVMGLLENRS